MATELPVEAVKGVAEWAKGQPFNNLLTAVLVAAVIGAVSWEIGWGRPEIISQIQSGYDRIEKSHRESEQRIWDFAVGVGKGKVASGGQ